MGLVIPDEFLQIAHMTEAELKLEIAILLLQQKKINLATASEFAHINQLDLKQVLGSRKIPIYYEIEDFHKDRIRLENDGVGQPQVHPSQAEILQRIEQRRTFCPAQYHLPDTLTLLQEDRAR
ncbi:UPF0175 family protein [Trichothermofontia sp.]